METLINREHREKKLTICVLGKTGGGKSSFLNAIIGQEHFKSSSGLNSCTEKISSWEGIVFDQ